MLLPGLPSLPHDFLGCWRVVSRLAAATLAFTPWDYPDVWTVATPHQAPRTSLMIALLLDQHKDRSRLTDTKDDSSNLQEER